MPDSVLPRPASAQGVQHIVDDHTFIASQGLNRTEAERDDYFAKLPQHVITKHDEPYPPVFPREEGRRQPRVGPMMIESKETEEQWRKHWADTKFADDRPMEKRGKTRPDIVYEILDYTKVGVVEADESGVFRDSKTNEPVFLAVRDFVEDKELLRRWTMTCVKETRCRQNTRRDDPGTYTTVGLSTGRRDKTGLNYAKVFHPPDNPASQLFDRGTFAGMASHLWNKINNCLPAEVTNPLNNFVAENNIPGLERNPNGRGVADGYRVRFGDTVHEVTFNIPTPASAGTAINYARNTHIDRGNPDSKPGSNMYMFNLTTMHTPGVIGGNFYLSEYRYVMKAAANTLVVFNPRKDLPGTTLPSMVPQINTGVGLYVTNLLASVAGKNDDPDGVIDKPAKSGRRDMAEKAWQERVRNPTAEERRAAQILEDEAEATLKPLLAMSKEDFEQAIIEENYMNSTNTNGSTWLSPDQDHVQIKPTRPPSKKKIPEAGLEKNDGAATKKRPAGKDGHDTDLKKQKV